MKLPNSWVEARLDEVCVLNPRLPVNERPDDITQVSFVPMSAVDEASGTISKLELRTFGEVAKGYTSFREGDVLFAKVTPCMENGKAAIAGPLMNGLGFGSTEFHVLRATEAVLAEYVFHFVRQQAFRDRAASAFVGTGGLQRVPPEFLSRVKLPLPSLPEQQRIVDLLQQANEVSEAKRSLGDQIDQLIRIAYWKYFSDWYTAEGLREPVRIADYLADTQYGVSEAMEAHGTHAVLRMNSLTTGGWLDLSELKYANLAKKDADNTTLQNGDLLFNRTNSKELVGKCAIWRDAPGAFSFASYLVRLRLRDGMLPEYLWATLNSAYGKYRLINAAKQAVSMANVSPTDLGRITVPLPSLQLQEEFARFVREVEGLRTQMRFKLDSFEELRNLVAQQALIGDLTAQWRVQYRKEIAEAAKSRDALLRERGTKLTIRPPETAPLAPATESQLPSRHWLLAELSEFQRQVFEALLEYFKDSTQPLFTEDSDRFAEFCSDEMVTTRLNGFEYSPNRIGRTISLLADLGLIMQITLPRRNPLTRRLEYIKAFRRMRPGEQSRDADVAFLLRTLDITPSQVIHYFDVGLDFETSKRAGAGGMFQVASLTDHDGRNRVDLVDQGKHYASLEDLTADIARTLGIPTDQVVLEEV